MPFLTYCQNKGCFKSVEPILDIKTNKVYCTECNGEINNITQFMKDNMKSMGQIKKDIKTNKAFSIKCDCGTQDQPQLKDNKLLCRKCNKELTNISAPYASIIKDNLRSSSK